MSNQSNGQPVERPQGKANDAEAGVKAPAAASTPAKQQETLINDDDCESTAPISLAYHLLISESVWSNAGGGNKGGLLERMVPWAEIGRRDYFGA